MHYSAEYTMILGEVVAEFGLLEWNVVYVVSLYSPGYVRDAEYGKQTAGRIAGDLKGKLGSAPPAEYDRLKALSERFDRAYQRRNEVLHGKPCTAPSGSQRLTRKGTVLEPEDLRDRIVEFKALAQDFNVYYYAQRPAGVE